MKRSLGRLVALSSLAAAVGAASGCGSVTLEDIDQVTGAVPETSALSSSGAIAFQELTDDVGARAATETRAVIRSRRGYQDFFGHAPPAGVDFSRQWVIFYAAGTKNTGGYDANILAVGRAGGRLLVVTQLVSPGTGCAVTQSLTTPFVLVTIAQPRTIGVDFRRKDTVDDCTVNACAAVLCPAGSTCDPATGACIGGPKPVTCGGIAGIPCPGLGKCVDDPSDSCDPNAGGADCGGICQCVENVLCTANAKFDPSPSVCACVPSPPTCGPVCTIFCQYGNVVDANGCPTCQCNPPPINPCGGLLCPPGTHCESQAAQCVNCPAKAACVPNPSGVACGGIAGLACPGNGKCVDDPNDGCDPSAGGADCGGVCQCVENVLCTANAKFDPSPSVCACVPVPPAPVVHCGGIAGRPCPGIGKCVDDPSDTCDPAAGGADCGGICQCVDNILCIQGTVFDASPDVCTCVPAPACATGKCPGPAPAAPNSLCADGKTVAGPACLQNADGSCGWTIVSCPKPATAP